MAEQLEAGTLVTACKGRAKPDHVSLVVVALESSDGTMKFERTLRVPRGQNAEKKATLIGVMCLIKYIKEVLTLA